MNSALEHYGIPGMKWGIHRYQRKDGGRTSAGNKRGKTSSMTDDELTSKVKRLNLEKQYKELSKENTSVSKTEKTKKIVDATSTLVNQAKNLNQKSSKKTQKMDLSKMTDEELRDRINRTNLERQYNDMFAPATTVSKGRQYVSNILDGVGSALVVGSSALGIALAVKELRK